MSASIYGMENANNAQQEETQEARNASVQKESIEPKKKRNRYCIDKCGDSKLCGGLACLCCFLPCVCTKSLSH